MSESYFQMVRGMWLSVLCITEMSRMMYFNVCKIMLVCTEGLFPYLISTVNVQRIKNDCFTVRF